MSTRKGYVGEGMTVEKLNSDTAERRLVSHRFPDCQAKLEMSSFLLKTFRLKDIIPRKEEAKSGPALLSKIGGCHRRLREP